MVSIPGLEQSDDFRKKVISGFNPFYAANSPMSMGTLEVRPDSKLDFSELSDLLASEIPDFFKKVVSLQEEEVKGKQTSSDKHIKLDYRFVDTSKIMLSNGFMRADLHQNENIQSAIVYDPFGFGKYLTIRLSTELANNPKVALVLDNTVWGNNRYEDEQAIVVESHKWDDQLQLYARATYQVQKGSESTLQKIRFSVSDKTESALSAPMRNAEYSTFDKFERFERGLAEDNIKELMKIGIMTPKAAHHKKNLRELVINVPASCGSKEITQVTYQFPDKLNPEQYISSVVNGTVNLNLIQSFNFHDQK